jgi:tripartite-type tricarboxylate transporter receptor subunit TctC
MKSSRCILFAVAFFGLQTSASGQTSGQAIRQTGVSDFYRNKLVMLVIGTGPGGAYDINGRLVGRHINRHIPGNPKLVIQNMPGAGSIQAGNYLYGVAPQDGTVLGNILNTVPLVQILGQAHAQFDAAKLQWIGNLIQEGTVAVAWHTANVKTIDDARRMELLVGATSPASLGGMYPKVLNKVAGTKFKVITGYKDATAIDLAMERGEVQGRAGQTWFGPNSTYGEWRRAGMIDVLVQIGPRKSAGLPDVPLMTELATTEDGSRLAELFTSPEIIGKPTVVGPGVAIERVEVLRKAYADTMNDPAFLADAKKAGVNVTPISGTDLTAIVRKLFDTPKNVIDEARVTVN